LGTEVVKVIVGKGNAVKEFAIHRALLTAKSEIFKTAFQNVSTKTADLPDDHAFAFDALVEWLYRDKFMTIKPINPTYSSSSPTENIKLLYIAKLAFKYSIWELLNRATVGYVQYMHINNLLPSLTEMSYIYQTFPPDSKIRRFVAMSAAFIIQSTTSDHDHGEWKNLHLELAFVELDGFLRDVLELLRNCAGRFPTDPRLAAPCEWHDHAAGDVCPWGVRYADLGTWEV
jgi:BTB/POZ domain